MRGALASRRQSAGGRSSLLESTRRIDTTAPNPLTRKSPAQRSTKRDRGLANEWAWVELNYRPHTYQAPTRPSEVRPTNTLRRGTCAIYPGFRLSRSDLVGINREWNGQQPTLWSRVSDGFSSDGWPVHSALCSQPWLAAGRPAQREQMQAFPRLSGGIPSNTSRGTFAPLHQQALTERPAASAQPFSAPQSGHLISSILEASSTSPPVRTARYRRCDGSQSALRRPGRELSRAHGRRRIRMLARAAFSVTGRGAAGQPNAAS